MNDMRELNRTLIAEYRQSGGVLSGPMDGAPILLLTGMPGMADYAANDGRTIPVVALTETSGR